MVIEYINDHYNILFYWIIAMSKQRIYSKYAKEAVTLLGDQIKLRRKQHKWSEKNLAERAGISRATLQKIEHGEMSCAIGLVFEVAALVGVNLFEQDKLPLSRNIEQTRDKIALLPRRIKTKAKAVYDDF
jgi:transcriptional regulator with XRE-family HTH domain